MDDQLAQPEPSTSDERPSDGQPGRRPPRSFPQGPRGGSRGRGSPGRHGPAGTPPGLGRGRKGPPGNWDSNGAPRQQYENAVPDLPIGTKLQGFVDHVRENFGFIRVPQASDLVFFHISQVQAEGSPSSTAKAETSEPQEATPSDAQAASGPAAEQACSEQQQQQPDKAQGAKQQQQGDLQGKKRDLSELLQPGDPVEFTVAASSQDGVRHKGNRPPKLMGKEVRKLPPGVLATSSVSEKLWRGRIERPLAGSSASTWNREANGGGGGLICCADPEAEGAEGENAKRLFLTFEGSDVKGRTGRLNKGDPVQFFIATDARTGKRRATQVQRGVQASAVDPEAPREQGFVDKFMNTYGFVRGIEREGQPPLFFHISEVAHAAASEVASGSEVSFSIGADPTGKAIAIALELLPAGTLAEERLWQGRVKGRVVKAPAKTEEQATPGRVTFQDSGGTLRSCTFTADQVRGGEEAAASLAPEDEVEFGVVANRKTGGFRAENVELLCKAEHRRELGQIKQLKESKETSGEGFGFIRACDRAADVFFHFSQLSGVSASELSPGDDVEFSVVREPLPDAPKRVVAHRVTRAPKGSAVFEVVSEEAYSGVVIDRLVAKGSNIASGLLQYEADGVPSKLTYGPKDLQDAKANPKPQDHVTFRIAVNPKAAKAAEKVGGAAAQHAGRRATQVALVPRPGRIFSFKGTFGFLEYDLDSTGKQPPRLYFHANDVEGSVQLRPGDEVTFTMANRPPRAEEAGKERGASPQGAFIARRVVRTKEAPAKAEDEPVAERGPQPAPKFIKAAGADKAANAAKGGNQAVRIARGPDGSKGFAPGRGRPLPPGVPSSAAGTAAAPGSVLRPSLSSNSLNPTAAEFVPRISAENLPPAAPAKSETAGEQSPAPAGASEAAAEAPAESSDEVENAAATAEDGAKQEEESGASQAAGKAETEAVSLQ